jgi:hypothetical protein
MSAGQTPPALDRLPDVVRVHGAKGGTGATTVSLGLALRLGAAGRSVALQAVNAEGVRALAGRKPDDYLRDLGPGVNAPDEWEPDVTVYDNGTTRYRGTGLVSEANIVVVRNDYASTRAVVLDGSSAYDLAVLFVDPARPLTPREVRSTIDLPLVAVPLDSTLAAQQDAGLYCRVVTQRTDSTGWLDLVVAYLDPEVARVDA